MKKALALLLSVIFVLSGSLMVLAETTPTPESKAVSMTDEVSGPKAAITVDKEFGTESLQLQVDIPVDGEYTVGMLYKSIDDAMAEIEVGLKVDGNYLDPEAEELHFPRMWMDYNKEDCVDDFGNEYAAQQVPYDDYYYNIAMTEASEGEEALLIPLTAGIHTIELLPLKGSFALKELVFAQPQDVAAYEKPASDAPKYDGPNVVLEGEDAYVKSSYFLVGKTDSSSVTVTPNNAHKNLINYVGGGNWKESGDTLCWETPELEAGYYQIGFSYRQNGVIGGKTYRTLTIDGQVPFAEAEEIGFGYDDNWQQEIYGNEDGEPYLIWLSEGKHRIALTVTAGAVAELRNELRETIADLGEMYMDISMITGEEVDIYRDYELFSQIPNMEERLTAMRDSLVSIADALTEITGEKNGSQRSVIMNMVQALNLMLENKFEAHRYKKYYYTNYCSTSSVLQDLSSMPLSLDRIVLTKEDAEDPFDTSSWWEQTMYSVTRFFDSFTRDYSGVSSADGESEGLTIWVNWGRDQAQVLSALIDRSFTPQTGIEVDIKLTNATVIQATISGNGPDLLLQRTRSDAVNLGMRDVLYDLSEFEDCDEVLERFHEGAELPYRYQDALYALPDTQTFYMMFYRTDIFEDMGLEVPETWDDFQQVTKLLMRNNMSVWLNNAANTSDALAQTGVGSINVFPSMLMQRGQSLYEEGGKSTTLLDAETMEVFKYWTDYYTKLKIPTQLDFYNRFRTGTTPLGIMPYSLYTTLVVTASEIEGQWAMTKIPGTLQEDGSISHVSSGGGTGCSILKQTKNPEAAWEFLKWWTSDETQRTYSNDVEAVLGPTGRIALANKQALSELTWEDGMWEEIEEAWEWVEEVPEYPGSYYVSRSIYQGYWNVVNDRENVKDVLMEFGKEANDEITRKWQQYQDRK
ncbi:MAG: extracellular solute-binding protein [Faecalimonas sp.]|nr:extracellular solute-binding protein [Faecalimonas sp.]